MRTLGDGPDYLARLSERECLGGPPHGSSETDEHLADVGAGHQISETIDSIVDSIY